MIIVYMIPCIFLVYLTLKNPEYSVSAGIVCNFT